MSDSIHHANRKVMNRFDLTRLTGLLHRACCTGPAAPGLLHRDEAVIGGIGDTSCRR